MYVNGKMRPIETVQGIRVKGIKEADGEEMNPIMIHCKNFCKYYNILLAQQFKNNNYCGITCSYGVKRSMYIGKSAF
jgi:hypothetical protein